MRNKTKLAFKALELETISLIEMNNYLGGNGVYEPNTLNGYCVFDTMSYIAKKFAGYGNPGYDYKYFYDNFIADYGSGSNQYVPIAGSTGREFVGVNVSGNMLIDFYEKNNIGLTSLGINGTRQKLICGGEVITRIPSAEDSTNIHMVVLTGVTADGKSFTYYNPTEESYSQIEINSKNFPSPIFLGVDSSSTGSTYTDPEGSLEFDPDSGLSYGILSTGIDDLGFFQVHQYLNGSTGIIHPYGPSTGEYANFMDWTGVEMTSIIQTGTDDYGNYVMFTYLDSNGEHSIGIMHPVTPSTGSTTTGG